MSWSGSISERSIYDKYIVRYEGQILLTQNQTRSLDFYSRVMDFSTIKTESSASAIVSLPENKKLFLKPVNPNETWAPSEVVLRVRNGFEKLHNNLAQRIGRYQTEGKNQSSIAESQTTPWGKEFTVSDPDGNRLIFFQPKRRSLTRM